jgi:exodeoxyribonuclease VII small subunit
MTDAEEPQSPETSPESTEAPSEASTDDAPGVEATLTRLEEIVAALESEDVSLERSLALFEEGVQLADGLKRRLEQSELRVKQVIEDAEGFRLEDFDL